MKLDRLDQLIATLERAAPGEFNMEYIFATAEGKNAGFRVPEPHCGTAACIAGWCAWVGNAERNENWDAKKAAKWLGLSRDTMIKLFTPNGYRQPQDFPIARAVDVLKHMRKMWIANGEEIVCWENFPLKYYQTPAVPGEGRLNPACEIAL